MDLTPSELRVLRTTFIKRFQDAYTETPTFWPELATAVPSGSSQNDYGWMAAFPSMREWVGPRTIENLKAHHYAVINKTYELTFGVKREDIEDDNLGVYSMKAEMHGEAAAKHPDELIINLLQNGESEEAFDGQNFFDTDHPENPFDANSATYSNFQSSGCPLDRQNFLDVRAEMMAFKNEGGRPFGIKPNMLLVPPALEGEAIEILEVERSNQTSAGSTTGGGNNVTFKMAEYKVLHELAGEDDTWYLGQFDRRIKPFVYQLRRPLNITSKDSADDLVVLEDNELRFYADIRDNAGVTLPWLLYKCAA